MLSFSGYRNILILENEALRDKLKGKRSSIKMKVHVIRYRYADTLVLRDSIIDKRIVSNIVQHVSERLCGGSFIKRIF